MRISIRNIPSRVYVRYGLLMIPGTLALVLILIVIGHWVVIPVWLFGTIVALSIAKDVIMFPFVWQAYDQKPSTSPGSMIARRGIAKERLAPVGYIQVGGELWRAEKIGDGPPIEIGEWVRVKKIDGLKLFVIPMKNEGRHHLQ
jgi:membrane protein implicated in regulation of membrane protease activity